MRTEGHEVTFLTGSAFRARFESSGAKFVSLPTGADFDLHRLRASQMADEFARIDTRSKILSIINQAVVSQKVELWAETMTTSGARRAVRQR